MVAVLVNAITHLQLSIANRFKQGQARLYTVNVPFLSRDQTQSLNSWTYQFRRRSQEMILFSIIGEWSIARIEWSAYCSFYTSAHHVRILLYVQHKLQLTWHAKKGNADQGGWHQYMQTSKIMENRLNNPLSAILIVIKFDTISSAWQVCSFKELIVHKWFKRFYST